MRLLGERYRISRFLRTDNLYKFLLPSFGNGYFLVNRKPVNVNSWFDYDVDQSILHTYVAFCVLVEGTRYKIIFQLIHKTAEGRNISEYVYKKTATLNDYMFFINLLYKAPLINYQEI